MNDIFKSFKNLNMTLKTPKNQTFKIFKKSCKEASNEKIKNQTADRIEKYKKIHFQNFKKLKITQKGKILKIQKLIEGGLK